MIHRTPAGARPGATGTSQSLFVAVWLDGDEERVRYFTDEAEARAFLAENAPGDAFSAIGAWGDLDWEDFVQWLDRVRHESPPTPPIDGSDCDE